MTFDRVFLIICDSMGIGEMPDATRFGDAGRDTLGHLCARRRLRLPTLQRLGLGNIRPLDHLPAPALAAGAFGKAAIASDGKDTTTGHWEISGVPTEVAFPTYPNGFPADLVARFEQAIGRRVIGNYAASGTEIIKELGDEHVRTGSPILYTSADSVFQIAMHEGVIPLDEQIRISKIARALLEPPHRMGRVIMRPFAGESGGYQRTKNRQDLAVDPHAPTLCDRLQAAGHAVVGVGKIGSIFNHRGMSEEIKAPGNPEALEVTTALAGRDFRGLAFINLVDFDMLFGHRRDADGYSTALETFDTWLGGFVAGMRPGDLGVISADHGCDPTGTSTDHSREYVPILAFGPRVRAGVDLGTRTTMADIGQTIAANFRERTETGTSFLAAIQEA